MLQNYGVQFKDFNKLEFVEFTTNGENLEEDYILIENKAIGFGPYDTGFITGRLKTESKREFIVGLEGCGIVVKVGKNCNQSLLNKKVAYLAGYMDPIAIGSFAKYSKTRGDRVVELPEKIDFNQGAYILGNPLTAKALFDDIISKSSTKAILQDTSSSALGKMITKICLKNQIKIINIVRKEENFKHLEEIGSNFNLNSTEKEFPGKLASMIKELNPDIYLTYQGGNLPSRVIDKMPFDSKMVSVGNINNEKLNGFSTTDFIFKGKSIEGFQVLHYLQDLSKEGREELNDFVKNSLVNGEDEFRTNIFKELDLKDFQEALELYKDNSSLGKIILKP